MVGDWRKITFPPKWGWQKVFEYELLHFKASCWPQPFLWMSEYFFLHHSGYGKTARISVVNIAAVVLIERSKRTDHPFSQMTRSCRPPTSSHGCLSIRREIGTSAPSSGLDRNASTIIWRRGFGLFRHVSYTKCSIDLRQYGHWNIFPRLCILSPLCYVLLLLSDPEATPASK